MATNDFKPFATGAGANVTAQAEWASLPTLFTGFQSGKASSAQVNKAIRQASFISAALAQYVTNKTGQNVLDDGDMAGFIAKLVSGLGKDFQSADATLTNLSGKSVAGLLSYLGLQEGTNWSKTPGGLIVQRGTFGYSVGTTETNVTLPRAFTTNGYIVVMTWSDRNYGNLTTKTEPAAVATVATTKTTTGFRAWQDGSGGYNVDYIAVGY
ncbi:MULTISPECIES: gp53-like domain-containing protein [Pseudescherichia]|uniref:gp53-like domain-containing protein n=1 Tax=Pseudescherichia TaxID=2055880 RepID=UPI00301C2A30